LSSHGFGQGVKIGILQAESKNTTNARRHQKDLPGILADRLIASVNQIKVSFKIVDLY
jgi:hypothetical protein